MQRPKLHFLKFTNGVAMDVHSKLTMFDFPRVMCASAPVLKTREANEAALRQKGQASIRCASSGFPRAKPWFDLTEATSVQEKLLLLRRISC